MHLIISSVLYSLSFHPTCCSTPAMQSKPALQPQTFPSAFRGSAVEAKVRREKVCISYAVTYQYLISLI
jgi:hypothetical protein